MPIECRFDIQNKSGRFYDQHVCHVELVRRCLESRLNVVSEGEVIVSCDSFKKSYFMDAFVNAGSMYELKAVDSLGGSHEAKVLNDPLLSSLQFGKRINFSSPAIQHFESYKKQRLKLLDHTSLKQLQWVNFNREKVQLITLKK